MALWLGGGGEGHGGPSDEHGVTLPRPRYRPMVDGTLAVSLSHRLKRLRVTPGR